MEMGDIEDENHIYYVSVGRASDKKILISAITNKEY